MVSNVLKPAASSRMPATNGTTATSNGGTIAKVGGGKYNLGADRKTLKKLRRNGIVNGCGHHVSPSPPPSTPPPPPTLMGNQTKTKGAHSNEEGGSSTSLGDQSQHRRLVCPELAITYTGTVMSKRAGDLVSNQRKLESQLTSLSRKLREKQLKTVLTHARRQLNFRDEATATSSSTTQHDTKQTNLLGSLDPTKSDSESSDASNDIIRVDKHEAMDTERSSKEICEHTLPIQVDGASNERSSLASLSLDRPVVAASNDLGERFKAPYHSTVSRTDSKDDVFRENSSENAAILAERRAKSSQSRLNGSMRLIQQQLASLKSLMDDDVTDSSSDEEEESGQVSRREARRHSWEHTRSLVGSRWAWLHHRLTTLNKELCRLEHEIQRRPNKDRFSFARPEPSHQPSWLSLSNNSILEQLNRNSGNGSTTPTLSSAISNLQQKGSGKGSTKPSNGYTNHATIPASAGNGASVAHAAQYYPQLLLSEASIGAKLQVKDLLSPSPLGRNFLFFDDTGCSSARTRALERKASRRIVRKQQQHHHGSHHHGDSRNDITSPGVDPSPHPLISLRHELPSRVLLDAEIQRVLSEHSYAQVPLNKRRKAAAKLPHITTPRTIIVPPRAHHDHTSFSESPSPLGTPLSASSDRVKGPSRKRPSLMHQSSSSCDTPGPWSPSMFRPHTPILNTPSHSAPKKRRLMSSTPSFDIDNIVIPYSMASTTRVEKLEYKEIITPSWREVDGKKVADSENISKSADVQEQDSKDVLKVEEPVKEEEVKKDKEHITKSVAITTEAPPINHAPSLDCDEEDTSDESFSLRHEKCESIEKQKFLNFISGGGRRRTRPKSLASTPDASTARASSPHPLAAAVASNGKGKQKRVLLSPTPSEVELVTIRRETAVQSWTQREFPLNEQDYDALFNPPPPPKLVTVTPSPSPMPVDTRSTTPTDFKPSRTPSTTSTAAATPLCSPVSTPCEETPAISPAEWTVQFNNNTQLAQTKATHFPSLVLRLSKRTV